MAEIALDELAERLRTLSTRRLARVREQVLSSASEELKGRARANIRARLVQRSQSLVTSVRHELRRVGGALESEVSVGGAYQGLRVPYARLQEYGGTVVPVRGKYLTIPVGPALNAVGLARYESARQAPKLTFIRAKSGPLLARITRGKEGAPDKIEVWYVLRTSTTLQPKRFLRDAWSEVVEALPGRLSAAAAAAVGAA